MLIEKPSSCTTQAPKLNGTFYQVISDALTYLASSGRGQPAYLFTDEQLAAVREIYPDVEVKKLYTNLKDTNGDYIMEIVHSSRR